MKKTLVFVLAACLMATIILNIGGVSAATMFGSAETTPAESSIEIAYRVFDEHNSEREPVYVDQAAIEAAEWLPVSYR